MPRYREYHPSRHGNSLKGRRAELRYSNRLQRNAVKLSVTRGLPDAAMGYRPVRLNQQLHHGASRILALVESLKLGHDAVSIHRNWHVLRVDRSTFRGCFE